MNFVTLARYRDSIIGRIRRLATDPLLLALLYYHIFSILFPLTYNSHF